MTYKESLTAAMTALGRDPATCFLGYGVTNGKAGGTLAGVPAAQLIETPVAENLMAGLAIGMALTGRRPLVYFERFDFVLNAADAIVNHLDKMALMSRGEFSPAVILRCVVGNTRKPLFTGETHVQDLTDAFASMLRMPVWSCHKPDQITAAYTQAQEAQAMGGSTMIVEYKDLL
jgi:pyruvate/2-oxoglutarate/acetoin dehydrogenase E1 component